MVEAGQVRKAVIGLWLVFWGWVLYPVAFLMQAMYMFIGVHGAHGPKLPLAPPVYVISFLLAIVGVSLLASTRVNGAYSGMMIWAIPMVLLRSSRLFMEGFRFADTRFPHQLSRAYAAFIGITELLAAVGLVMLSIGLIWLCREMRLPQSERRWRMTRNLLIITVLVPFALCQIFAMIMMSARSGLRASDVVYFYFAIALLISYIPLIYFAVATRALGREAGRENY